MQAAVVFAAGQAPVVTDFDAPSARSDYRLIDVVASALSPITRARATGAHYSATSVFPFVAGIDGVGRLMDGQRVYFFGTLAPFGALAQRTLSPITQCISLPKSIDDVAAAAIAIPGMSSWAALTERAHLKAGQTVLINGATGTAGRLAVQIAKHLGAGRVIAVGRNPKVLQTLVKLGADRTIALQSESLNDSKAARAVQGTASALAQVFSEGVDIVLDYLWGHSARTVLVAAAKAAPPDRPICVVQVGSISGEEVALPAAVLRAAPITLMGSGIGSISLTRICQIINRVLAIAGPAKLEVTTQTVPLSAFSRTWNAAAPSESRIVFVMEQDRWSR
jgi:NADPH2:quinone reductase